ncbi:hypothetical protein ACGGKE_03820 [Sphingobium naphthae]|uniref:hypothetical protein n=1 Tax=Sphingobium naphthae TaxID=1886786 RepID=UPI00374786BF
MSDAKTPSDTLACQVIDRLIVAGHLRAEKRDALIAKMASGGLKSDDWRLEIELSAAKGDGS